MRVPVKEADRRLGPYPYYGASGVVDHVDSFIFEGLHLLIAEDGENLRTRKLPIAFLADGRFWVNNHAHIVRGNDKADTRFLAYALMTADITSYLTGSTMPKLTQGNLNRIPVLAAELDEQRAIASTLGALDDQIEMNRRMNATLEAMARAIFKDWFIDFGPTRTKMDGHAPYLAPEIWSLFPDRLDHEGKPEGWQLSTLNTVAALNPESWSAQNKPHEVEYVDLANTKWGTIETTEIYSWDAAPSRARRVLRAADTIVGTVRPGNGSYAFIDQDGLTGSTGFAVLRPQNVAHREMIYCAATSAENIERLSHLADGAAYPAVRPDVVADIEIVLGPPSVIDAFSTTCAPLIDRCEANKRENKTLAAMRDLLLPKLMSGEIRVPEAETLAKQAAHG